MVRLVNFLDNSGMTNRPTAEPTAPMVENMDCAVGFSNTSVK